MNNKLIQNWKNKYHIRKMRDNQLLQPESFEKLAISLQNSKNIHVFKSREVLSFFMIQHYPQIVLGNSLFDYYLQFYANKMFESYKKMCESGKLMYYIHFWHCSTNYVNYFYKWKNQDSYKIILPLLQEYFHLQSSIDSDYYQDVITELSSIQEKLLKKIKSLYRGDVNKLIKEYAENPMSLEQNVILEFHNKFWKDFYENLSNNDFTQVPMLLTDIFNMIKKIIPNREDIHNEYKTFIDTDLITQMINNNGLNDKDIHKYIQYIFSVIKQLQSASEDQNTEMCVTIIDDMFNKKFSHSQILTFSFSSIFQKLENILTQLQRLNGET